MRRPGATDPYVTVQMARNASVKELPASIQTALVLLLPPAVRRQIESVQAQCGAEGGDTTWPPHLTLLWPFLPSAHVHEAEARLSVCRSLAPFRVHLTTFAFARNSKYLHLRAEVVPPAPATALHDVYTHVHTAYPNYGKGSFDPHVSLGQLPQDRLPAVCGALQADWGAPAFDVNSLYVLVRDKQGVMRPRVRIALGEEDLDADVDWYS